VEDSILFDNCDIGRGARSAGPSSTKRLCGCRVRVGHDLESDRRSHYVTDSGIVVVEGIHSPVEVTTLELKQFVIEGRRRTEFAGTS